MSEPLKSIVTISDLLDIIHMTIIKEQGDNFVILDEINSIGEKIKKGELKNYNINTPMYWTCVFEDIKRNGYIINENR